MRSLIGVVSVVLVGCTAPMPKQDDPFYAPVMPMKRIAPENNSGSLYQAGYGIALYEDHLARRIGDSITVVLQENTTSSNSNSATITKQDKNSGSAKIDIGIKPVSPNFAVNTDNERNFTGNASAGQSNSLTGNVTATVVDVLPNGVLVVRGEKWLNLTHGSEVVRIAGNVRPEDIRPDNTVLSTRLADARVTYTATGELQESGEKGWFSRLIGSRFWPF